MAIYFSFLHAKKAEQNAPPRYYLQAHANANAAAAIAHAVRLRFSSLFNFFKDFAHASSSLCAFASEVSAFCNDARAACVSFFDTSSAVCSRVKSIACAVDISPNVFKRSPSVCNRVSCVANSFLSVCKSSASIVAARIGKDASQNSAKSKSKRHFFCCFPIHMPRIPQNASKSLIMPLIAPKTLRATTYIRRGFYRLISACFWACYRIDGYYFHPYSALP